MFNDVQLAKVSKINKTADWSSPTPKKQSLAYQPCSDGSYNTTDMCLNMKQSSKGSPEKSLNFEETMGKCNAYGFIVEHTSPRCEVAEVGSPSGEKSRNASSTSLLHGGESTDYIHKDNNESDNNISSCSTLDIVNKVENLSIGELENQIKELSKRLRSADNQREELQHKLKECTEEKELLYRRLEVISASHESRITEMHCVIAELSKKLRTKQESTILEENEPEGSEISYQEESIYNSEMNLTNPDAECQTDPLDGEGSVGGLVDEENPSTEVTKDQNYNEAIVKSKVEALQEEVLHLKAQVALLQSEIADNSDHITREDRNEFTNPSEHNAQCYAENTMKNDGIAPELSPKGERVMRGNDKCKRISLESKAKCKIESMDDELIESAVVEQCVSMASPQTATIIPKMAERVNLRQLKDFNHDTVITSFQLKAKTPNAELAEDGGMPETTLQREGGGSVAGDKILNTMQCSSAESECQRLNRKLDQLKMENIMRTLTLAECKEHCDQLYLLCGKYESNAIALQSAVNCSDRAIEAYDVMLALLESKMALMKDKTDAAEESRRAVESVARHLLTRLDSEKDLCENSLGPWKNTFSFTGKTNTPWTSEDDTRLRHHVSKLKGRRSTVQNTIVNLESPFSMLYEKSRLAMERCKEFNTEPSTPQMDLEMAIVMQELLHLREENVQLKSKMHSSEFEQQMALNKIDILHEGLQQLLMQLADDDGAMFKIAKSSAVEHNFPDSERDAFMEAQLIKALSRETEMKRNLQFLLTSTAVLHKNPTGKIEPLKGNVKDLERINTDLSQRLEYNKRKYQSKIRKLEQKISDMNREMILFRNITPQSLDVTHLQGADSHFPSAQNVPETIL